MSSPAQILPFLNLDSLGKRYRESVLGGGADGNRPGRFPEDKHQLEGEQSELSRTRLPCFLFFPCSFPEGFNQSASSLPSVWRWDQLQSAYSCGTHTHTHSPMVTSMVTVVIQKAFKEVELENLLLHLETCLQSSLSFISVTERGFMLFTQRSVNTVGIVVCLHSPNTTVHTYFCCL